MHRAGGARYRVIETAAGPFAVVFDDRGDLRTTWLGMGDALPEGAVRDPRLLPELCHRLERYFAGDAVDLDDVPTPPSRSGFVRACWRAVRSVGRGHTCTYSELAAMAGNPRAARAAGSAMKHNPLPVIVPCHRVVASGGGLGGYGGGPAGGEGRLSIKRWLLRLEGAPLLADPDCAPPGDRGARPRRRAALTAS